MPSIKKKYRERLINCEQQWPPSHSRSRVLFRLELAKDEQNLRSRKATVIAYSDIFKSEIGDKPVRKVLVEGDAGIGKTIFCTSIAEDWANGLLFQQFELLLLLPLRHIRQLASQSSLSELLKLLHSSPRVCNSVASYIEEEEGENVLIIADGWDELPESDRHKESFLFNLLFRRFPLMSIILTSRPSISGHFHSDRSCDLFVTVHGFDRQNIQQCIESELSSNQEKAKCLLEKLEHNPVLASICSIPLNCVIVCHLWHMLEEALPTTMSALYTKIILNVVLRSIGKSSMFQNVLSLPTFDDLPQILQEPWAHLCRFAFEALRKEQVDFSKDDLDKIFPQGLEMVLCFGLLQSTELVIDVGRIRLFHFLHLTFQEFLAALHLMRQPPVQQLEVVKSHSLELGSSDSEDLKSKFTMMYRFYFGIEGSNITQTFPDIDQLVRYAVSIGTYSLSANINLGGTLFLCHCAFEARCELFTNKVIHQVKKERAFSGRVDEIGLDFDHPRTAHDCTVIIYIISKMQECVDGIELDFYNSNIREEQVTVLADALAKRCGRIQITSVNLCGNNLSDECVSNLFSRASCAFQALNCLDLGHNRLESQSIHSVAKVLEKTAPGKVVDLNFSQNRIEGASCLHVLERVIQTGSLSQLQSLCLQKSFQNGPDVSDAMLATFFQALSSHCHCLQVLDLSENNLKLGVQGASSLAQVVSTCINIKLKLCVPAFNVRAPYYIPGGTEAYLAQVDFGDLGLRAFLENLKGQCKFSMLDLVCNGITAIGMMCLSTLVCSGKLALVGDDNSDSCDPFDHIFDDFETVSLHLDFNPLGLEGARVIGNVLRSSYCKLTKLTLCNCQLANVQQSSYSFEEVGRQLCQMPVCKTITHLYLDCNCFTGDGIHILAGFMFLCPRVCVLSSDECEITTNDLMCLLNKLIELKTVAPCLCDNLMAWHLKKNKIDDGGVSLFIHHLRESTLFPDSFWALNKVCLSGNPVSKDMIQCLSKEFERRQEVRDDCMHVTCFAQ